MKYGIIGASGRMGQEIARLFNKNGHQLVYRKDEKEVDASAEPEIMIDFSLASAFPETLSIIKEKSIPLIIGTTGLNKDNLTELHNLAAEVPVIQSFNFSIGINILSKLISQVNNYLDKSWDLEMTETHHRFKKDKPSGTALMLAELLKQPVEIHAKRLGSEFGEHKIEFASTGELISLKHRAYSREAFSRGVLLSAEAALELEPGFYSFQDILN
ncbi:4-hydroxy-tetrahydrodipicolinate reductase [Halanaerobium salsuginis]|jgi:4-hydroxy-tetrahydrodipicolinate reductase|uniref:4-hydroxy-tetrahydrodipicolinate reductase n=1 Tax=Halanaerobium salsuginis TaxID=29563 RepID=A0A1I4LGB4_9FIRM|nr:dihydrodipicolinate reductase C-terminal domain-containing protein [Halanaerobium salsuginis]SFL89647.1 dihydrodipicolinate reductase [Halanaerobium salsuginis]